jgi:hypothetical protein
MAVLASIPAVAYYYNRVRIWFRMTFTHAGHKHNGECKLNKDERNKHK